MKKRNRPDFVSEPISFEDFLQADHEGLTNRPVGEMARELLARDAASVKKERALKKAYQQKKRQK